MRHALYLFLLSALVLAGCRGSAEPTPTPTLASAPTQPPAVAVEGESATETPFPTVSGPVVDDDGIEQVPEVVIIQQGQSSLGVIDNSAATEEVTDWTFELVELTREGGIGEEDISIAIRGDGTFTRNGVDGTLNPAQATLLNDMLRAINFFGMDGQFSGSVGSEGDDYVYSLTVEGAPGSKSIRATSEYTPPELQQIFDLILTAGA